ncbi:hypothetical protein GQ457_18G019210 [Hibiscus cannabinus]
MLKEILSYSTKKRKMISAKKLIKLAKRWQKMAFIRRKRITLPRTKMDSETNGCSTSSVVDKGHFVVHSGSEAFCASFGISKEQHHDEAIQRGRRRVWTTKQWDSSHAL